MPKRIVVGSVTSDKTSKTRRVEVPRLVKHPRYGKIIRRKTVCYAHDENNESHVGDRVEIVESRPRSKLKRWELVRVVEQSRSAAEVAVQDGTEATGNVSTASE
jgi:small subunit ribosomal protein S17